MERTQTLSPLPPEIHAFLTCKINSFHPLRAPQSLYLFQHQLQSLISKASTKYHSNQTWMRLGAHFILRQNSSLTVHLWNQTNYVLPKSSGGTGIRYTFPFQEKWERREGWWGSQARPKLRAKSMKSYTLKNNHLQLDALPYTPTRAAVLTSRSFSVSKSVLVQVLQRQRAIEGERERENIDWEVICKLEIQGSQRCSPKVGFQGLITKETNSVNPSWSLKTDVPALSIRQGYQILLSSAFLLYSGPQRIQ